MMRRLTPVLAVAPLAACLMVAGHDSAQADPTPTAKAQQQAPAGDKSSAAEPAKQYDDPHGTVIAGPFIENTKVHGKIDTNLSGVWLLVGRAEITPGQFKTFPQIIKITQGKDGPQFNLLDVKLPPDIDKAVYDANNMTLSFWKPSDEVRKTLAKNWSKLPPHKEKKLNDFLYSKIEYTVMSPDGYAEVFGAKNPPALKNVLEGSRFSFQIVENLKPRNLPPDNRIAQLMKKITVYGVKSVEKDVIKGTDSLGIMSAGAGQPIPMSFNGPFEMYRLGDLS
jgi:hypothetical protein